MDYVYDHLLSAEHIRILELEPSQDVGAPLRCQIIQRHLDDASPCFDAISYTWGGQDLDRPLHVGSFCTRITANLDAAFRRVRSRYQIRRLWADAVCINQNDDSEKSSQIPHMASIFRSAVCVRVWLGEDPTGEHGKAIESLVELAKARKFTNQVLWSEPSYPPPPNEAAVAAFLRLPWFTRRWIIQELVLNTDAMLYCGSSKISWPALRLAITKLGGVKGLAATTVSNHRAIDTLGDLSLTLANRGISNHSILELLQIFDDYGCSDPRDRLFALLGLASDVFTQPTGNPGELMLVRPDYSLPWSYVYCKFARSVVKQYGLARALLAAEERRYRSDEDKLPSWVANLQHAPRQLHQVFSDLYNEYPQVRNMVDSKDNAAVITVKMSMYTHPSVWGPRTREVCWDGLRVQSTLCKPFDVGEADLAESFRSLAKWMLEQLHVDGLGNHCSAMLAKLASLLAPLIVFKDDCEDIANDEEHDYVWDNRSGHRKVPILKRFRRALVKMTRFPSSTFAEACASFADQIDPEHRHTLKQPSFYVSTTTIFVNKQPGSIREMRCRLMGYVLGEPQPSDIVLVDWSSGGGKKPPVMLLRRCGNKYQALGCSAHECFESTEDFWSDGGWPYYTGEQVTEVELDFV